MAETQQKLVTPTGKSLDLQPPARIPAETLRKLKAHTFIKDRKSFTVDCGKNFAGLDELITAVEAHIQGAQGPELVKQMGYMSQCGRRSNLPHASGNGRSRAGFDHMIDVLFTTVTVAQLQKFPAEILILNENFMDLQEKKEAEEQARAAELSAESESTIEP